MTCFECQDVLLDASRGETSPDVRQAAMEHAAGCRDCTVVFERQRSVTASLRALAAADAGRETSGNVEARLLDAFVAATAIRAAHRAPAVTWLRVAAALVACTGAAWGMVSLLRPAEVAPRTQVVERHERAPGPEPGSNSRTTAAPAVASLPAPAATGRNQFTRAARVRRPRAPAARAATVREPRPFVQVPMAAALPDFESGEIVRLGIPVRSLPSYGLEIPPDAPAGRVVIQADLLIGQDGLPRAIRLVSTDMVDRAPQP